MLLLSEQPFLCIRFCQITKMFHLKNTHQRFVNVELQSWSIQTHRYFDFLKLSIPKQSIGTTLSRLWKTMKHSDGCRLYSGLHILLNLVRNHFPRTENESWSCCYLAENDSTAVFAVVCFLTSWMEDLWLQDLQIQLISVQIIIHADMSWDQLFTPPLFIHWSSIHNHLWLHRKLQNTIKA